MIILLESLFYAGSLCCMNNPMAILPFLIVQVSEND